MTYSERARAYAKRVVAGKVPACQYVVMACKRHLDDLARMGTKGFALTFDTGAGDKVCQFIELLPHIKGEWARERTSIRLEDWQCFIVCVAFGWMRADGRRRYRRVYVEVPRKNGKSSLTAGLGLYMFCLDGEHGAEVYSGAGNEKQAWEVFGPARLMAKNTPALLRQFGVEVNAKNLNILSLASKFEPIIGKPGDGASPSFSITDEYHEHQTSEQYDTMLTGMGARRQPMSWVITTAGASIEGPCYNLRSEVVNLLRGNTENDELFGIIYTLDDGDDWSAPESLDKCNPNIGVSVDREFLLARQKEAINNPWNQATFKAKHLNVWQGAASPFFNLEKWNRLADPSLRVEQFKGESCWIGMDLASKLDLASTEKVFKRIIEGVEHFYVFGRHYLPEEVTQEPGQDHYRGWAAEGKLIATPGNVTDYDAIEDDIKGDAGLHRIVDLGFDPHNATHLVTHLMAHGITCTEVQQTVLGLSEPMKWLQALIVDERIHHDGDPVLAWAIGNVTAQVDRNENVFPRKERAANKIDPAVALIIAMARATGESEPTPEYQMLFLGGRK